MNEPAPTATTKSRGGRRPIVGDQALIKQSVRLDQTTLAAAIELGAGNLSAGVRTAVEMALAAKAAETDAVAKAGTQDLRPQIAAAAEDPGAFFRKLGRIV